MGLFLKEFGTFEKLNKILQKFCGSYTDISYTTNRPNNKPGLNKLGYNQKRLRSTNYFVRILKFYCQFRTYVRLKLLLKYL